jgi:hypothetical protein
MDHGSICTASPGPAARSKAARSKYDEPRAPAKEFGFTLHLRNRGEEAWAKRHAQEGAAQGAAGPKKAHRAGWF